MTQCPPWAMGGAYLRSVLLLVVVLMSCAKPLVHWR